MFQSLLLLETGAKADEVDAIAARAKMLHALERFMVVAYRVLGNRCHRMCLSALEAGFLLARVLDDVVDLFHNAGKDCHISESWATWLSTRKIFRIASPDVIQI